MTERLNNSRVRLGAGFMCLLGLLLYWIALDLGDYPSTKKVLCLVILVGLILVLYRKTKRFFNHIQYFSI